MVGTNGLSLLIVVNAVHEWWLSLVVYGKRNIVNTKTNLKKVYIQTSPITNI